jgi:hypothetical protein
VGFDTVKPRPKAEGAPVGFDAVKPRPKAEGVPLNSPSTPRTKKPKVFE